MNTKFKLIGLGLAFLGLTSCSGSGSSGSDYVSVQLEDSKMWSLLNFQDGKLDMTDEFFAPSSRVVKGSFFVENDDNQFDLYNLKDTKNKLNRSSFSVISNFNDKGYAIVRVNDEPWQIIDTEGKTLATLDKNLDVMSNFSNDGLALIAKDDNIGYINTKGEIVIKPHYNYGTIFTDGVAIVVTERNNGDLQASAIDTKGETLFTFSQDKYSQFGYFHDGYLLAVSGDNCVLLDKEGKKVMTVCKGNSIANLSNHKDMVIYTDGQFYGVKNIKDEILIRAKYLSLSFQSNGDLLAMNSSGKYGVITSKDEIVTPFDYDHLEYLAPGRYITTSGNLYIIIDNKGKEVGGYAFTSYSNRSGYNSEIELSTLISGANNTFTGSGNTSSDVNTDMRNDEGYNNNYEEDYSWLSTRELTYSDLYGMSSDEIRLLRNAIFARHGYIFRSEDLLDYFSQFSWYYPLYSDVTSLLNPIEIKNIQLLKSYE